MPANKWGEYKNYCISKDWGTIDSVFTWNRKLTNEETNHLYNYGCGQPVQFNPNAAIFTFECYHDLKNGKLKVLGKAGAQLFDCGISGCHIVFPCVASSYAKRVMEESGNPTKDGRFTGRITFFNSLGRLIEEWILHRCYFYQAHINLLIDSPQVEVKANLYWSSRDITTY